MTKNFKTIKIEDYGVVVDDSEIIEGNWYLSKLHSIISQHNGTELLPEGWKKIIGSIGKRLESVPFIEFADLIWERAWKIAEQTNIKDEQQLLYMATAWYDGYHSNINKYNKSPLYALKAAISILNEDGWEKSDVIVHLKEVEEFLQSLQKQPIPTEIELEMEVCEYCGGDGIYIDGDNNRLSCEKYAFHTELTIKITDKETNTITAVNYTL